MNTRPPIQTLFYAFVLSCVCYVFVCVCLYVLCGHLLGKGWPLGSRLWCLIVSLSLSHWYPGPAVVLDCINSWSLHPYLLIQMLCHVLYCCFLNKCKMTSYEALTLKYICLVHKIAQLIHTYIGLLFWYIIHQICLHTLQLMNMPQSKIEL